MSRAKLTNVWPRRFSWSAGLAIFAFGLLTPHVSVPLAPVRKPAAAPPKVDVMARVEPAKVVPALPLPDFSAAGLPQTKSPRPSRKAAKFNAGVRQVPWTPQAPLDATIAPDPAAPVEAIATIEQAVALDNAPMEDLPDVALPTPTHRITLDLDQKPDDWSAAALVLRIRLDAYGAVQEVQTLQPSADLMQDVAVKLVIWRKQFDAAPDKPERWLTLSVNYHTPSAEPPYPDATTDALNQP